MNELVRFFHSKEYEHELKEEEQKLRNSVISEQYLWDMRCWENYKDP
jgi:hypothetical protein